MLRLDLKSAAGILDALDERCGPTGNPWIHDLEMRRARCWAEQQRRMIDVMQEWLVRQANEPGCDLELRQALELVRRQLGHTRRALVAEVAALDRNAGLPRRAA